MAIHRLVKFGLSEKEAKVYVAALEIGAATSDTLAKHAKLNRSTTYVQLQELLKFGLVSTFKRGKKTFFAPESPHNLTRIVERKHQELDQQKHLLESFVPELLSLYTTSGVRPVIRSFEGKEGLMTIRDEVLKTKAKDIYVLVAYGYIRNLLTPEELNDFTERRVKRKIRSHLIYSKEGEALTADAYQELRRIDANKFPFESDMYIFGDNVALISYKGEPMGVIIESASMAKTFRSMFALMWEAAQ